MSVYHGEDLFVMADGVVLAGSKSCELDISADVLEKAPQTNGQWREFLPGRKSWQLVTNHLLLNQSAGILGGIQCKDDGTSVANVPTGTLTASDNLTMYAYRSTRPAPYTTHYANTASGRASFADDLENLHFATSYIILVGNSFDFTDTLTTLTGMFNYITGDFGTGDLSGRNFILFGQKNGLATLLVAENNTTPLHFDLLFKEDSAETFIGVNRSTRIMPFAQMVGQTFNLSLQAQKYSFDRLQGAAICRRFKVTATKGNLMQGSFEWIGTGPLT